MRLLLPLLLAASLLTAPAIADGIDPTCQLTQISTCWQGCYRTTCGGLGGGTGIGFAAKNGLWYSTCQSTGANCGMGVACQWMSLVITYQDCVGSYQFLMVQPCCEAGTIWLGGSVKASTCAAPVDSMLPIAVLVPREI